MTERTNSKRLSEGLEHFRFRDCLLFRASDFEFQACEKSEPGEIPGSLRGGLFHFMMV
jgi:hypothetical protein